MLIPRSLLQVLPVLLLSVAQILGISRTARSASDENFVCPTIPAPLSPAAPLGSPEPLLPPIPRLVHKGKPNNPKRQPNQLVQTVRRMGSTPEVCTAAHELSTIGNPATPVILPLLKDADLRVRSVALQTLLQVKRLDRSITSDLRSLLSDASPAIRARTLNLLSYMILDQSSKAQIEFKRTIEPWLTPLLRDENPEVRFQAGIAVILATDLAKLEIPTLIALLKTPRNSLIFDSSYGSHPRIVAAIELGNRGETAKAAIPAILQLLEDSPRHGQYIDYGDKLNLVGAIVKMGETAATNSLVSLLNHSDEEIRNVTVAQLACRSSEDQIKSQPIVAALLLRLDDPNLQVKTKAIEALGCIRDPSTFPALVAMLKDDNSLVEQEIQSSLWQINLHTESAASFSRSGTPEMLRLLREPKASVRARVAKQLGYMIASAHLAVPALIPLLNDSDAAVRSSATKTLKQLGYQP